jgi:small nuclear ribonucleoprotein E
MSVQDRNSRVVPIQYLAELVRRRARVEVWLYENTRFCLQGTLRGFDDHINLVLEDVTELWSASVTRKAQIRALGTVLLKGENLVLLRALEIVAP